MGEELQSRHLIVNDRVAHFLLFFLVSMESSRKSESTHSIPLDKPITPCSMRVESGGELHCLRNSNDALMHSDAMRYGVGVTFINEEIQPSLGLKQEL